MLGHDAPMRIGINGSSLIALGRPTSEIVAQAAAAEADGFSTYWAAQLAVPDALTALAVVAGATSTIELGTAVIPIWLRHPLMLAAPGADPERDRGRARAARHRARAQELDRGLARHPVPPAGRDHGRVPRP